MSTENPLEAFLDAQEEEGRADSEGSFTISRDQALAKLSAHHLPFAGAWAIKLIQAAVAGGAKEITVRLERADSRFYFSSGMAWTSSQVEQALFDTEPQSDPALNHLVTALRVVGFSQKRAFRLCLPGKNRALEWDGTQFKEDEDSEVLNFVLHISNRAADDQAGFLGINTMTTVARRHADVTRAVTERCHLCPVPLTLDGRRIDAIELNPSHGWGPGSQLLVMGFEDGELPRFPIPQATLGKSVSPGVRVEPRLKEVTAGLGQLRETRTQCGLAFLVSAHLKRVKKGKNHVWREFSSPSICHWVKDGILLEPERLGDGSGFCSVGCFVSAEGLSTDLSGLALRDTPEKAARLQQARRLLKEGLSALPELDFKSRAVKTQAEVESAGKFLLGAGALFTLFTGFGGVAVMLLGGAIYATSNDQLSARETRILESIEELKKL